MLEHLGKDIATEFEDVDFIGLFHGLSASLCTFNCNRTGATFCANSFEEARDRLNFIRSRYKLIEGKH